MGVFDKAQKRKSRLVKKRTNTARAARQEFNADQELQRMILAVLVMQDEMIFGPGRYYDLLLELSGDDADPIDDDSQMYWVIVAKLRKLTSWLRNLDAKGRQWEISLDYAMRVRKQVENGDLPVISMWLEAQEDAEPVVTETGKTLGESNADD